MALKLGELLINEGLLNQEQLEEALKCQVIFGIKLGSSLIELGFIEEGKLAKFLSKKLGVPAASRKELMEVPYHIYSLLPSSLAERYRVIPFKLENKRLHVAMTDPTDINAIDELSFVTGYIIQPFIAPDIHISFALEKLYQVNRDLRYIRVPGGGLRRPALVKPEPVESENIEVVYQGKNGELLNIEIPREFEGFASLPLPDLPEEMFIQETKLDLYTIDRLSVEFSEAKERDEVADIFIKYLGQEFNTCALFILRGTAATGWRAISNGQKITDFDGLNMLLSKPSVLRDIFETRAFSLGALINTPENSQILKMLAIPAEASLLVLPVVMLNKVVAAVLVSADMDALGKRLAELQKLVRKASLAFEMLIIKNKILET
ncbi:MAG TPA: hypothetical protein VGJ93_13800 [Desulfuromonadaceae bacterium]|jgi:hypothetical protein